MEKIKSEPVAWAWKKLGYLSSFSQQRHFGLYLVGSHRLRVLPGVVAQESEGVSVINWPSL